MGYIEVAQSLNPTLVFIYYATYTHFEDTNLLYVDTYKEVSNLNKF